jgi:hypothetical protein
MKKRKQELAICANQNCKKEFLKDSSEIKRNQKIGRRNYCTSTCCGSDNHKHLKQFSEENKKYLVGFANNRRDQYTGLKEHFRRIKKRKHKVDITLDDLLNQWEKQKGKCAYSGVDLVHPNQKGNNINTASLDRIDSSLGYVKGNIQFVSIICNQAKNNLSHQEMITFLRIIGKKYKN